MTVQISEDVQKVLDIIGDTAENRAKLLPIVEELQAAGKSLGRSEKAPPPPEDDEEEEEEEEEKVQKPEEDEDEEEEGEKAVAGGLIGAIVEKIEALKAKVPEALKDDVDEILKLSRNLRGQGRYPYPEAKEVAEVLRTGVLENLRRGLEDSVTGLFQQYAQRVESLEGQLKEEQAFSERFRELLASQPKSTLRPSQAADTRIEDDDKTVEALKSTKKGQILPGFFGHRMGEEV